MKDDDPDEIRATLSQLSKTLKKQISDLHLECEKRFNVAVTHLKLDPNIIISSLSDSDEGLRWCAYSMLSLYHSNNTEVAFMILNKNNEETSQRNLTIIINLLSSLACMKFSIELQNSLIKFCINSEYTDDFRICAYRCLLKMRGHDPAIVYLQISSLNDFDAVLLSALGGE